MIWEDLDKKLIHLQAEAGHANDIFDQLGTCFINEGYSRSDYVEALKQREAQFPTGLDINGFGVAIPHTDAGYVLHETEGIMTLKHPVTFIQMGSDDTQVEVKVVFMLAIEDPKNRIKKLQQILRIIQDNAVLEKIYQASSADEVIDIVKQKEIEIGGENL